MLKKSLIDNTRVAILWAEAESGLIIECNKAAENLFARKRKELIGMHQSSIHPPEKSQEYVKMFKRLIKQNGEIIREAEIITKTGEVKPVLITTLLTFSGGKPVVQGIFQDATKNQELIHSLNESESRFKTMFEVSGIGIALVEPNGTFLKVNKSLCSILGYSKKELLSSNFQEITHPEDIGIEIDYVEKMLKGSLPYYCIEKRYVRKDGEVIWILLTASLVCGVDGRPLYFVFQVQDIDEQRKALKDIKGEKARIQEYLKIANVIIIVIDSDQKVSLINKKGCEILGYSEQEIIGKNWFDNFIPEDERAKVKEVYSQLISGELAPVEYFENNVLTASGEKRIIGWHNSFLRDNDGKIISTLGSGEDVTEKQKIQNELVINNEVMKNLAEGVVLVCLRDAKIISANSKFEKMFGYKSGELIGKDISVINAPGNRTPKEIKDKIALILKKEGEWKGEVENIKKDGARIWCYVKSSLIDHSECGRIAVEVHSDITERKKAERALQSSESRYRRLFETACDGMMIIDVLSKKIIAVNPALVNMLGYSESEIIGNEFCNLGFAKNNDTAWQAFKKLRSEKSLRYDNLTLEKKNGEKVEVELISSLYLVGSKKIIQCNIRDITKRVRAERLLKQSEQHLKYVNSYDPLTGIYNRAFFAEEMARLSKDFSRSLPLSILSLDIDRLKLVNDTFGHKSGDKLLVAATKVITTPFRKMDLIARVGGDEFCIILPQVDYKEALVKRDKIKKLINIYNSKKPVVPMHISIGVATAQDTGKETVYDVYQRADDNMYEDRSAKPEIPENKVIEMLVAALSERDFISQGHLERLSVLADKMADAIALSDNEKRNLDLLAKMHDLGKVGIPDKILFKPKRLSEKEYEKMKEHVKIGHIIASRSKELSHIANLILYHHEWWNGKGYLTGLKGEQIPLECRILTILDSYDAMTNVRPYHLGVSKEEAVAEIRRCSGTQFDPELVDKFTLVIEMF
ncbi:MAG: PAS domain S-box protein [Candidatus Omnitrophica bacterium]|nr:PAS domain S-box protein [Candidatus Omnitrophota bacterium]